MLPAPTIVRGAQATEHGLEDRRKVAGVTPDGLAQALLGTCFELMPWPGVRPDDMAADLGTERAGGP